MPLELSTLSQHLHNRHQHQQQQQQYGLDIRTDTDLAFFMAEFMIAILLVETVMMKTGAEKTVMVAVVVVVVVVGVVVVVVAVVVVLVLGLSLIFTTDLPTRFFIMQQRLGKGQWQLPRTNSDSRLFRTRRREIQGRVKQQSQPGSARSCT